MPEQLAFDQICRDRGGIDSHERARPAVAKFMDRLGNQFLAGPAFTGDEHGEIIAQHARDHPVDALHGLATADQRHLFAFTPRQRGTTLVVERGPRAGRLAHGVDQLIKIEGLGEILKGFALARPDCRIERVLRRQHDHRHVGRALADCSKAGEAIPVLEDHIGEHDGKAARGKLAVARRDAGTMDDGKALVLERGDDHRGDCGIILDKQDRIGRWCRHGVSSDRVPAGDAGGSW